MTRTELLVLGLALLCLSLLLANRESNNPRGQIVVRLIEGFSIDAIKAGLFS